MIRIKRCGQRTTHAPRYAQLLPPITGAQAAEALGLKLVAAINGRAFFSKPVPVRYSAPRRQFVTTN